MKEKPKFEICRSINNDLCVTVDSLDYILAKTMHSDTLGLKPEDWDLITHVLHSIRYQLSACVNGCLRGKANGRKPKFEICQSFGGNLCTTVDSLDDILTGKMYGDKLKLRKEDQDLVRAVLGRIRYDLNSCIIDFMEEERRKMMKESAAADTEFRAIEKWIGDLEKENGQKTEV